MDRNIERLLLELPQPIFFIGLLAILVLAALFGRWLRIRLSRKYGLPKLGSTQEEYVVSAIIGLLALLLGFSFSMAVDHYDRRLQLVTDEANAITSVHLMAQTFDERTRGSINQLLSRYTDTRLALAQSRSVREDRALLAQDADLQKQLWGVSLAAAAGLRDDIASSYLQAVDTLVTVGQQRIASRMANIPPRVYLTLLIYTAISATVLGYACAYSRQTAVNTILFVLLTLSLVLIIDLDRPTSGGIRESQKAMERVKEQWFRSST